MYSTRGQRNDGRNISKNTAIGTPESDEAGCERPPDTSVCFGTSLPGFPLTTLVTSHTEPVKTMVFVSGLQRQKISFRLPLTALLPGIHCLGIWERTFRPGWKDSGMMLHQDDGTHEWTPGVKWDLGVLNVGENFCGGRRAHAKQ